MHLVCRNINDGFQRLTDIFHNASLSPTAGFIRKESRNGPCLTYIAPLTISYTHPHERVLFNPGRDANPFFHLYEAMWMLAGRNDLKPLQWFVSNFGNYSDDGKILWGAYGHRWRKWFTHDQIENAVKRLRDNPDDRRTVIQMWDGTHDLEQANKNGKDVPCNMACTLYIHGDKLHMTVFNRSNDLIWGMLGANYVHFSFLQEYIAGRVGKHLGMMNQVSSNCHAYLSNFKHERYGVTSSSEYTNENSYLTCDLFSGTAPRAFDVQLKRFLEDMYEPSGDATFLKEVLYPSVHAYECYKHHDYQDALHFCERIASWDWRSACTEWVQRRMV